MHIEQLQALTADQREIIKKLFTENRQLIQLTKSLRDRIQHLERQHIAIDNSIIEIPIDLDLIAERDLKQY